MMNRRFSPPLSSRTNLNVLPLWKNAVFVDWYGVLSYDVFWKNILRNTGHRFNAVLQTATTGLFGDHELIAEWMRGRIPSEQIIELLRLADHAPQSYWLRALKRSCIQMAPDAEILRELRMLSARGTLLILATDNMDCFFQAVDQISGLDRIFDGVLCSCELGVLKSEDPRKFFGKWLERNGLQAADAYLLDDSNKNCVAFRELGGTPFLVSKREDAIMAVRRLHEKLPFAY